MTSRPQPAFQDLRATDVIDAAERLRSIVRRTPLRRSAALTRMAGGDVFLKLENRQLTGSFKLRGAFNTIAALPAEVRARGVVASSAGNHGLGVAWAARHFDVPATIFVPASTPEVKRTGIASLGAVTDASAPSYDDAMALALRFAAERGARFLNPCAGEALIAGQGTIALEILDELPQVASVVVPVGGAGLLAGVGSLLRHRAPRVRVVGVQSVRTAAMARSLAAGRVVPIPNDATLAEGLAGGIDEFALDVGRHVLDTIVTVSEEAIACAIAWMAQREGEVVEGAGAVGPAALLTGELKDLPTPAAILVTGGNIDPARHEALCGKRAAGKREAGNNA